MPNRSRRRFLQSLTALPALANIALSQTRPTDLRIEELIISYEQFQYRTPYKFGGVNVDRATVINVSCRIRTRNGKTATGFGSMPLGNIWSFPSREMSYDTTLGAMRALAEKIAGLTRAHTSYGHPIDINVALESEYLKAASEVSAELRLAAPIPKLCTLVTASAFDAAIHDAFGKAHGVNCYRTYGTEFMSHDLSHYLGPSFKGEFLDRYILKSAQPSIAIFHSVGGSDPIVASDIPKRLDDGLPETLAEWIRFNGLTHIKIKLQGEDLKWDINRVVQVDRVASETKPAHAWQYCVDFNERCPNVDYVLEFLRKVKELSPNGFSRILYLEQPTARDLRADRKNTMHEAAKLRPVVIDESLTDQETLMLAREMGYTGVALKACKGQSQAMLMAAASQKHGMFLTVQDLTCPGASLLHSVGIGVHVPRVAGIEANARQYIPKANEPWEGRFPGVFKIRDGRMKTQSLRGPGLGVT